MLTKKEITELFVVGYERKKHLKALLAAGFSNFILYSRNTKTMKKLVKNNRYILKHTNGNALISMDEEGGNCHHIFDICPFCGNYALSKSKKRPYAVGKKMGENLKKLGVNFCLAPCVDTLITSTSDVIGSRSYGFDGLKIAESARDYALGLNESGVLNSFKHFPNYRTIKEDTHQFFGSSDESFENLRKIDLVPYRKNIDVMDSVMVGHLFFPKVDNKYPASLSKVFMKDILRDELGFKGLVVTDCFEMNAIKNFCSIEEAVETALKNGADMIFVSHTESLQKKAVESVEQALTEGRLNETELREKIARIKRHKQKVKIKEIQQVTKKKTEEDRRYLEELYFSILENSSLKNCDLKKSVLISGKHTLRPFTEDEPTTMPSLKKEIKKYCKTDSLEFNKLDEREKEEIIRIAKKKAVILALGAESVEKQKAVIALLEKIAKSIKIIFMRMKKINLPKHIDYVEICDYTKESCEAVAKFLAIEKEN